MLLGRVRAGDAVGDGIPAAWRGWRGVGAAQVTATPARRCGSASTTPASRESCARASPATRGRCRFSPTAPRRPPPAPAAALPLTVDGQPVDGRLVGWLRRFPTIAADQPGFVVADEATLAGALDASLPGQGRPDELWIDTPRPGRSAPGAGAPPLDELSTTFRADVQRSLRGDPVARGVMGTLGAAAAVSGALAILGLLAALAGAMRDRRLERDLAGARAGPATAPPRAARCGSWPPATLGTSPGWPLAALLTRLVVAAVRAAGAVGTPDPPLVAVAPWGELLCWRSPPSPCWPSPPAWRPALGTRGGGRWTRGRGPRAA